MKKIFLTLCLLLTFSAPLTAHADETKQNPQDVLYAISFYADWCVSCKTLDPKMMKARGIADFDNQNILFVTLDLTNATTRHQASLMADVLGISEFYEENNGTTGFVLLYNPQSNELLGTLTRNLDSGVIIETIQEKLKSL